MLYYLFIHNNLTSKDFTIKLSNSEIITTCQNLTHDSGVEKACATKYPFSSDVTRMCHMMTSCEKEKRVMYYKQS